MPAGAAASKATLLEAPIWRVTFRYGAPIAVALAFHGLFNLADLVFLGRLGRDGVVAAVNLASILVTAPLLVFDGACNAGVAWIARSKGAGLKEESAAYGGALTFAAIVASALSAIVYLPIAEATLRVYDFGSARDLEDATTYLRVSIYGGFAMYLLLAATAYLRGLGDARRPVILLLFANALNLVLDAALVFGLWGFPRLEAEGAAYGTVAARAAAALAAWAIVHGKPKVASAKTLRDLGARAFKLVREGAATSLQLVVRAASFLATLAIAEKASDGGAAHLQAGVNVAQRIEMIPLFLALGFGAAATAAVGQNLGARRFDRAEGAAWWTAAHAAGGVAALAAVFWIFRRGLYELVAPGLDPRAVAEADAYWLRALPSLPIVATGAVLARAMNGASETKVPLLIDALCYLAALPLVGIAWSRVRGPVGAWEALVFAHVLAAAVYAAAFVLSSKRRRARVEAAGVPA